uniref:Uncharacterized protein n=1 Tax=uncultured marine virus TaxID=186617 RepID=A0A0F7L1C3_9VIRU|nr:hypothetical protein [uncultured marine virus]
MEWACSVAVLSLSGSSVTRANMFRPQPVNTKTYFFNFIKVVCQEVRMYIR